MKGPMVPPAGLIGVEAVVRTLTKDRTIRSTAGFVESGSDCSRGSVKEASSARIIESPGIKFKGLRVKEIKAAETNLWEMWEVDGQWVTQSRTRVVPLCVWNKSFEFKKERIVKV